MNEDNRKDIEDNMLFTRRSRHMYEEFKRDYPTFEREDKTGYSFLEYLPNKSREEMEKLLKEEGSPLYPS